VAPKLKLCLDAAELYYIPYRRTRKTLVPSFASLRSVSFQSCVVGDVVGLCENRQPYAFSQPNLFSGCGDQGGPLICFDLFLVTFLPY
jgi:hypothetical protein